MIAFARFDEEETFITAISGSEKEQEIVLPIELIGNHDEICSAECLVDVTGRRWKGCLKNGELRMQLPAFGAYLVRL